MTLPHENWLRAWWVDWVGEHQGLALIIMETRSLKNVIVTVGLCFSSHPPFFFKNACLVVMERFPTLLPLAKHTERLLKQKNERNHSDRFALHDPSCSFASQSALCRTEFSALLGTSYNYRPDGEKVIWEFGRQFQKRNDCIIVTSLTMKVGERLVILITRWSG